MSKRNRKYVQVPKNMENGVPVNTESPENNEEQKMDRKDSAPENNPEKQDGFFKKHWKKLAAGGAALIAAAGGVIAIFFGKNSDPAENQDDPETENNGSKVSLDDLGEKLDALLSKFDELE